MTEKRKNSEERMKTLQGGKAREPCLDSRRKSRSSEFSSDWAVRKARREYNCPGSRHHKPEKKMRIRHRYRGGGQKRELAVIDEVVG